MSADADALEHWVTARIDEKPIGRSMAATGRAPDTKSGRKGRVESHGQKLRVVDAGQENDGATDGHEPWLRLADAEWGPEGEGGRIMLTLTEHVPVGPPTAPLVARMLRALDLEWTMGLPPLVAAAS
jgi:hypothetical protein